MRVLLWSVLSLSNLSFRLSLSLSLILVVVLLRMAHPNDIMECLKMVMPIIPRFLSSLREICKTSYSEFVVPNTLVEVLQ